MAATSFALHLWALHPCGFYPPSVYPPIQINTRREPRKTRQHHEKNTSRAFYLSWVCTSDFAVAYHAELRKHGIMLCFMDAQEAVRQPLRKRIAACPWTNSFHSQLVDFNSVNCCYFNEQPSFQVAYICPNICSILNTLIWFKIQPFSHPLDPWWFLIFISGVAAKSLMFNQKLDKIKAVRSWISDCNYF